MIGFQVFEHHSLYQTSYVENLVKVKCDFYYTFDFDVDLQGHGLEIADLNSVMCAPTPKDQVHESKAPT